MKKRKAFTLIDNLITGTIIVILAGILFPVFSRARENARRSSCQSHLKQIGLAFLQYANNYDRKFPPVANAGGGWTQLLQPYLKSEAIFQCPSANGDENGATDYFYNARLAGAKNKWGNNTKPVFTILSGDGLDDQNASYNLSQFADAWRKDESSPAWRHLDGANYLFIDGHVKWFKPNKITLDKPSANRPTFLVR